METGPTPSEELSSTLQAPQPQERPPPQMTTTTVQSTMMGQPGIGVYPVNSCRSSARCVAYVDIVVSIIATIFSILLVVAVLKVRRQIIGDKNNTSNVDPNFQIVLAFIFGMTAFFSFIDLCISCALLSAADLATRPSVAIGKAKCWLWFNIILLIFYLGGVTTFAVYVALPAMGGLLFVFLRVIFVIIVWNFIVELEMSEAEIARESKAGYWYINACLPPEASVASNIYMGQSHLLIKSVILLEHILKSTNTKVVMDWAMDETQLNLLDGDSWNRYIDGNANTDLAHENDALHTEVTIFLEKLGTKLANSQEQETNPFFFETFQIVENIGGPDSDATTPDFEIILLTVNHSSPSKVLNLLENVLKGNSSHFLIDPRSVIRNGNEYPMRFKFNSGCKAAIRVVLAGTSFYDMPVTANIVNEEE